MDVDAGADFGDIEADSLGDAVESVAAFKLFSIRAILAFCTMFSWAMSLYLDLGSGVAVSLLYATAWGLGGGVLMALLVNWMRKLAETGTQKLSSCVGTTGSVYMDIPSGGAGKVRVKVTGAIAMISARSEGEKELKAGTPVKVLRMLDPTTVEVAADEQVAAEKKGNE